MLHIDRVEAALKIVKLRCKSCTSRETKDGNELCGFEASADTYKRIQQMYTLFKARGRQIWTEKHGILILPSQLRFRSA